LSWSPDGQSLVFELGRNAGDRAIYMAFLDRTELLILAESAHAPAISSDGNCLAFIKNQQVFLLDLTSVSSTVLPTPLLLADLPTGRGQADFRLDKLGWGSLPIPGPDTESKNITTPTPSGEAYDWRGIKLYLNAPLPDAPAEANVYQVQPAQPTTLESTVALAAQFGMSGDVYETPSLTGDGESDFIVVDVNQRLLVGSSLFYSYYPDYARWIASAVNAQLPEQTTAEEMIAAFLTSHGFDFSYKVVPSGFFNGYYALPLTPDGFTVQHEHFSLAGMLFRFDNDDILAVEANLADYTPLQNFGIIPAEAAFQKVLDPNIVYGIREGMHSATMPVETWDRPRPENQTITVWGWISSLKSINGGSPLVTFDGFRATGNITDIPEATPNTYVEAIGQFQTIDGRKTFDVESWQVYNGYEEGLQGTIQREGDRITLTTIDGNILTLPDIPANLPLPVENAFVLGVTQGEVFEWKSIDTRMQGGGGGGGGGGGSGFYKPNLTGTPVPLPTTIQASQATGTGEYIVQEGDTLSGIAESYGITVDVLMQANGLNEATIFIGQSLIIPGSESGPEQPILGQSFDKIRGTLTVTIFNLSDGGQRVEYSLQVIEEDRYLFMRLDGNDLDALQAYNNRPIKVSGTVDRYMTDLGMELPVLNVEQFEVLYPDQKFQILKGTQSVIDVQGKSITLFTTEDGQTYAQPETFSGVIGSEGDLALVEALVLPEEMIAGYPVLQVVNASMAVNPKNGQPVEMEVTADKPYVMEDIEQPQPPAELFATIDHVELVYFTPNQRYKTLDTSTGPVYIQPVWRFQGHYWDGSEFEILVQALKDEFLLPEIETIEPPG
jgi:LysM repeat protein